MPAERGFWEPFRAIARGRYGRVHTTAESAGISTPMRDTRGSDIDAACGQLAANVFSVRFRMFGGDEWVADPRLDPFREAVWQLTRGDEVVAHLISAVGPLRSFPWLGVQRESMWFTIIWVNGEQDRSLEDYGPDWCTVGELEQGFYEDRDERYIARPVEEVPKRDELWERYKDTL